MRRREVVPVLAGGVWALGAGASQSLDRFLPSGQGAAVLVDVRSRRLIAAGNGSVAARLLAPPGSTVKPFVLAALLRSGKINPTEAFPCPGRLKIGTRVLDCSHPPLAAPVRVDTALAYSCNCFVARAAERLGPGELARELEAMGLSARTGLFGESEGTGRIRAVSGADARRLQALGEEDVLVTVAELAMAYRSLALKADGPILAGLEGAVEYGTAQNARVAGLKVAGKTGTSVTTAGERIGWFAGFLPSAGAEVAVAVMVPGRSGGGDAAPVAGRVLEAYRMGRL